MSQGIALSDKVWSQGPRGTFVARGTGSKRHWAAYACFPYRAAFTRCGIVRTCTQLSRFRV